MTMEKRVLGRSGIEVSPLGLGCWAIGGELWDTEGWPRGWGQVDDEESIRAVRRAIDLGVTLFDTADVYGAGHSERVLGKAIAGRRDEVVLATKWSNTFDEESRTILPQDFSLEYQRTALQGSLKRLGTDRIDLFQLHHGAAEPEVAEVLRDACEDLVKEGLIRAYAWSTDDPARVELFAAGPHCTAVQHAMNVFEDAPDVLAVCERRDLASVVRSPLAMGLLAGRTERTTTTDVRSRPPAWLKYFQDGLPAPEWQRKVDAVRDVLTADGRSLVQGALGWIWARSERSVPIPGFRTVAQVEENVAAMEHGPLADQQMVQLSEILDT